MDNLHRRASEALTAARRRQIEVAMKNHPNVVDALWSKMQSLGMSAEELRKLAATALSAQAQAVKDRNAKASTDEQVKLEKLKDEVPAASATGVVDVVDPLADRVKLVGNLGVAALRDKLLPSINPAIMSSANIRAMRDPQQLSQTSLLRYLEFATGWPMDMELTGTLRCMNAISSVAIERAAGRGHRESSLTLPAEWDTDGIYNVEALDKLVEGAAGLYQAVIVRHRFTGAEVAIDMPVQIADMSMVAISYNWSETRAAITFTTEKLARDIILMSFFPQQCMDGDVALSLAMRTPKKQRQDSRQWKRSASSPAPSSACGSDMKRGRCAPSANAMGDAASRASSPSAAASAAPAVADMKVEQDLSGVKAEAASAFAGEPLARASTAHAAAIDESAIVPPPPPPPSEVGSKEELDH